MDPRQAPRPPWRTGHARLCGSGQGDWPVISAPRRQSDHPAAARSARTTMVSGARSVSSETCSTAPPILTTVLAASGACPRALAAAVQRQSARSLRPRPYAIPAATWTPAVYKRGICALLRPRPHQAQGIRYNPCLVFARPPPPAPGPVRTSMRRYPPPLASSLMPTIMPAQSPQPRGSTAQNSKALEEGHSGPAYTENRTDCGSTTARAWACARPGPTMFVPITSSRFKPMRDGRSGCFA